MSKASADALAELHGAIAETLKKAINAPLFDKDGNKIENTEGLGASAAVLGAAITFLKNNDITADPAKNAALDELKADLEKRRRDSKASLLANRRAAEEGLPSLRMAGDEGT
jgi:hypothetical protein